MLRRKQKLYFDILEAARDIQGFVATHSFATFASDSLVQAAVERKFEIIGEAMNRLAREFPDDAASVPHLREIIGMRNILAHGYDQIDLHVLWSTSQDELTALVSLVERRLF